MSSPVIGRRRWTDQVARGGALLLGTVPAAASSVMSGSARGAAVVVLVGSVALWGMGRGDTPAPIRLAWAAGAGCIVALLAGPLPGLGLAVGVLLADTVVRDRRLGTRGTGRSLPRWLAHLVGAVVGAVVFGVLSVPLLLVPWGIGRIARVSPLGSGGGWRRQSGAAAGATQLWSPHDGVVPGRLRARRVAVCGCGAALLAAVVVSAWGVVDGASEEIPAAFEDATWYPQYHREMTRISSSEAYQPLATIRLEHARSTYVNVVDGVRRTWRPGPCECTRLRVWFYGGSTAFGLGQRDLHTIPSELARIAAEHGVYLDIENRGVGGDTHWEAAQRFAWDLTVESPPDLAVFYDGTNEFLASRFGQADGEPPSVIPAEFWQVYADRTPVPAPGAGSPSTVADGARSAEQAGHEVAQRYERSRQLSLGAAQAAGVEVAHVWQPTSDLRQTVAGEPSDPGRSWSRERTQATRSSLAPDVIDVADVFQGVDRPLYYDTLHTNELGAHLVAEAIYHRLQAALEDLARQGALQR